MQDNLEILQKELAHVYWLGGSPCSGKSSIAGTLVETHGLRLYRADEAYFRHEKIVTPERQPVFHKLTHCSAEELWMRPVEQQAAEEITLYREEFPLLLDELLAFPKSPPILAEGAALLPKCVIPLLLERQSAIWVVPTATFQLHHYSNRAWARDVVSECTNPEQAFQNWMQRDIRFAKFVEEDARQQGMQTLVVDGTHSLDENTALVERYFQLG